jgi:hypothetical protein
LRISSDRELGAGIRKDRRPDQPICVRHASGCW